MLKQLKNYVWFIIFLTLSIIEYKFQTIVICGSGIITGQMWFMYFCMSLASIPLSYRKEH